MKRTGWLALIVASLVLAACGSSSSSTSLTCSASLTSTTTGVGIYSVEAIISGGTGPYDVTFPGEAAISSSSTTVTGSSTTSTGTVSVTDTSDNDTTSCTLGSTTVGTNPVGNTAITLTANYGTNYAGVVSGLPVGTPVLITALYNGIAEPFTFSQYSATTAVTISQTGTNSAYVTGQVSGETATIAATYNGIVNYITLEFGTTNGTCSAGYVYENGTCVYTGTGGYSLSCTLTGTLAGQEYGVNVWYFTIVAYPTQTLEITGGSSSSAPGQSFSPFVGNTVAVTAGAYAENVTVTLYAESLTGIPCNGTGYVTTTQYLY